MMFCAFLRVSFSAGFGLTKQEGGGGSPVTAFGLVSITHYFAEYLFFPPQIVVTAAPQAKSTAIHRPIML